MAQQQRAPSGRGARLLPILGVGFVVWLVVTILVTELVPAARAWAPVVGLLAAVVIVRHPVVMARIRALGKGVVGELTVAAHLSGLPAGWRAFHDVRLSAGSVDHVVVSNRGVFALHVVRSSGSVVVLGDQIVRNGKPQDAVVASMMERNGELAHRLGVDVVSVLVVAGTDPGDHDLGALVVTSADRLAATLAERRERVLELHEGRRVFEALRAMVRSRPRAPVRADEHDEHRAGGSGAAIDPRLRSTAG